MMEAFTPLGLMIPLYFRLKFLTFQMMEVNTEGRKNEAEFTYHHIFLGCREFKFVYFLDTLIGCCQNLGGWLEIFDISLIWNKHMTNDSGIFGKKGPKVGICVQRRIFRTVKGDYCNRWGVYMELMWQYPHLSIWFHNDYRWFDSWISNGPLEPNNLMGASWWLLLALPNPRVFCCNRQSEIW